MVGREEPLRNRQASRGGHLGFQYICNEVVDVDVAVEGLSVITVLNEIFLNVITFSRK